MEIIFPTYYFLKTKNKGSVHKIESRSFIAAYLIHGFLIITIRLRARYLHKVYKSLRVVIKRTREPQADHIIYWLWTWYLFYNSFQHVPKIWFFSPEHFKPKISGVRKKLWLQRCLLPQNLFQNISCVGEIPPILLFWRESWKWWSASGLEDSIGSGTIAIQFQMWPKNTLWIIYGRI